MIESLRKEYANLTPAERCDMIIDATSRADVELVKTLLASGPTSEVFGGLNGEPFDPMALISPEVAAILKDAAEGNYK